MTEERQGRHVVLIKLHKNDIRKLLGLPSDAEIAWSDSAFFDEGALGIRVEHPSLPLVEFAQNMWPMTPVEARDFFRKLL